MTFPYTKLMCANIFVDQAAALLLCSPEAARAAGVPDDRLVYLHAGADAADHLFVTERWSLAGSAGLRAVGADVLAAAGVTVDDIARFDLYSCFPSAVQVAMGALGLAGPAGGDDRPLTVTGGLSFFGGPGNNYVTHPWAPWWTPAGPIRLAGLVHRVGYYLQALGRHLLQSGSGAGLRAGRSRRHPGPRRRHPPAGPGWQHAGPATVGGHRSPVQPGREPGPGRAGGPHARRSPGPGPTPPTSGVLASMTTEEWAGERCSSGPPAREHPRRLRAHHRVAHVGAHAPGWTPS